MKKELDVANAGTLGMYFAWSDQLVSGRSAKQYNRTAPRKPKGSVKAKKAAIAAGTEPSESELNKLVNEFNKGVAAAQAKGKKSSAVTGKKTAAKKAPAKKAVKKAAKKVAPTNLTPTL
jgi:hypothetical protein